MLKAELFLRWSKDELAIELDKMTEELRRQGLITVVNDELHINPSRSRTLQLLAAGARETLQRYAITFWLLSANPPLTAVRWRKRAGRWHSVFPFCTASTPRNSSTKRSSVHWY